MVRDPERDDVAKKRYRVISKFDANQSFASEYATV